MKVRFGSFLFDSGARELVRIPTAGAGRADPAPLPVHLSPKAFDVLEVLLARRPNVVGKDVLLDQVWPGKVVEEANLAIVIGEVRKALGDDSRSPAIVVTVSRRGYRFAAAAQEIGAEAPRREPDPVLKSWLTWNDKTLPLRDGENLVGRHPGCAIWINASGVSRTHARIVASADGITVEDQGSRNGTFVNGTRISGRHVLVDGNTITFGSETAVFRQWSDEGAAGTEPVPKRRGRRDP